MKKAHTVPQVRLFASGFFPLREDFYFYSLRNLWRFEGGRESRIDGGKAQDARGPCSNRERVDTPGADGGCLADTLLEPDDLAQ